jgi:hypothetical protein
MRLHRRVCHFVGDVAALDNFIRFRESRVGIAEHVVIIFLDVVRFFIVDQVPLGLHRFFGIEIRGQRLVLDVDQLQRLFRDAFRFPYHARNVVSDVAHFADGERRLIMSHRQNSILVGSVVADHDRHHARQRQRAARVNFLDSRVRKGRMQNFSDQHSGQRQIVGVFSAAGRFPGSIHHRDRFADD